jgi:hypothetical protein
MASLARAAAVLVMNALRFCRVTRAAQPRAVLRAAGTALLPKRSAAKIQTESAWHGVIPLASQPHQSPRRFTAAACPVVPVTGAFTFSLDDYKWEGRPTRPQHPTACRSLGRRFAPRFSATLRVALRERKGTRPGERQSVGRLRSECLER